HDLSYVLNTAYRIAMGDVPYRDFSQPHAPLTFLIQAAIIKVFDSSYVHHMWYAALLSGAATLLTHALLRGLLRPVFPRAELYAFVGCLPLVPLGVHSLFPHPWYDADATFLALLALLALLRAQPEEVPPGWAGVAGGLCVLPIFAKQNVGLPLLAGGQLLALPWLFRAGRRKHYLWFLCGAALVLVLALVLIQTTCGLESYARWTFWFAAGRRLAVGLPFASYRRNGVWPWLAVALCGLLALAYRRPQDAGSTAGARQWGAAARVLGPW